MSFLPRTSRGTARRPRNLVAVVVVAVLIITIVAIRVTSSPRPTAPAVATKEQTTRVKAMPDVVSVAVDDATVLARVFPMAPSDARSTLTDIASTAYQSALLTAIDRELVPLQRQAASLPGKTIFRQSVLAIHRLAQTSTTATVAVWMVIIVGQAGQQANPAASFATVTLDLIIEGGKWKLNRVAQQAGPTPLLSGQPDLIDGFDQRLDGFSDWRN